MRKNNTTYIWVILTLIALVLIGYILFPKDTEVKIIPIDYTKRTIGSRWGIIIDTVVIHDTVVITKIEKVIVTSNCGESWIDTKKVNHCGHYVIFQEAEFSNNRIMVYYCTTCDRQFYLARQYRPDLAVEAR